MGFIAVAAAIVLAVIDQVIKYFVVQYLPNAGTVQFIPHILSFVYVENRGVAFGMFKDIKWIVIGVTSIVIIVFIYILLTKKVEGKLFYISSALILGGGIGNLIDRVFLGFVVDYLQLSFFNPVCNFADYCVTVGVVLLVVYLLFYSDFFKDSKKRIDK